MSRSSLPIVGFRAWRYFNESNSLTSLSRIIGSWPTGIAREAECINPSRLVFNESEHHAPDLECDCGIYSWSRITTHHLSQLVNWPIENIVLGATLNWGKLVLHHTEGLRAQFSQPLALANVDDRDIFDLLGDCPFCNAAKVKLRTLNKLDNSHFISKRELNKISKKYNVPILELDKLEVYALEFGTFNPEAKSLNKSGKLSSSVLNKECSTYISADSEDKEIGYLTLTLDEFNEVVCRPPLDLTNLFEHNLFLTTIGYEGDITSDFNHFWSCELARAVPLALETQTPMVGVLVAGSEKVKYNGETRWKASALEILAILQWSEANILELMSERCDSETQERIQRHGFDIWLGYDEIIELGSKYNLPLISPAQAASISCLSHFNNIMNP